MDRYLAFDFGTKRIGVASGQTVTRTAQGIETVRNSPEGPDWPAIDRLVKEWCPKALIVGLPFHMDGSENEMCIEARRFATELQERSRLPVHTMDERLSTKDAREQVKEQHKERIKGTRSKQYADKRVDAYAAKLILETWFSMQR